MELGEEALFWYRKRFRIETFFSDQKSRGFNLHRSHIDRPVRLARLLIACCLAYIWIVWIGANVRENPWAMKRIHRSDRCDLSLFQLGLAWLEECLNQERHLPEVLWTSGTLSARLC